MDYALERATGFEPATPSVYDSLKGLLGEAERSRFVRAAVRYYIEQGKENSDSDNGKDSAAPN